MNTTGVVALVIIVSVLCYFLLFMWASKQDKKHDYMLDQLHNPPATPLARLTLEAHFTHRELGEAISTGTPEEIEDALNEMVMRGLSLKDYLEDHGGDEEQTNE